MDMSFARRRRKASKDIKHNDSTPDLSVLLADISARQGASRTALIQSRLKSTSVEISSDPLIDIFSPRDHLVITDHRFSGQIATPVIPRKLK